MFDTKGIADRKFQEEIYHLFSGKKTAVCYGALSGMFFLLCIFLLLIRSSSGASILALGNSVCLFILIFRTKDIVLNTTRARHLDMYETETPEYQTAFLEETIRVHLIYPCGTDAKELSYSKFVKLISTSDLFLLSTKSGLYVPVFKSCLDEQQQKDFIEFIKTKIPNIAINP